jgi:nucleotide-binding universal stress UspA family protein
MSNPAPGLGRVLCATDLSEFGNRAVPLASGVTARDGRLTLLHVLRTPAVPSPLVPRYGEKHASPEELDELERACSARLHELARPAAASHGVHVDLRVVRGTEVGAAIVAEAERVAAELICLATHSRGGLAQVVLGSSAHAVLHHAHRPVLLVPPPAGG